MKKLIKSILFFPSVTKSKIIIFLGVTLVATCFEGFGVAMLFPIMDFIEKGKNFEVLAGSSRMWTVMGKAFDLVAIPKNLIALMSIVFILLLLRQLFNYLKNIYIRWINECFLSDIRSTGFKWFAKADVSFYDSHGVGELINALVVDGLRASGAIFCSLNLVAAVIIFLIYFILLLVLSPGMTLFAVGIMGCVGLLLKSRISESGTIGHIVSRYNEKISGSIVERLNGIRLLKLAATEEEEAGLIRDLSEEIKINTYGIAKIRARMEFYIDPLVILSGLIILYLSVEVFHMSLAKTGVFIFVLLRLMPYTREVFSSWQGAAGSTGSLYRVKDLLNKAREECTIRGGRVTEVKVRNGIRFDKVSFYYNREDGYVIEDMTFSIPAGRMTALVGRSGAGKSTIADLIPRLRVPVEGKIYIDDLPLEDFDLKALRRSIAFVSQEGFLFNDTIENNIRYGRPDASQEEVIEAAEMAYADLFIREFPEGYQTKVGEKGTRLSGGQRQRIVLARALIQRASIIILDEPTSSLDSESETYIQRAMERIREKEDITMIIIAHRLSTIRRADQIIVLDRGRMVECGSHGELMHEESWYADMVKMQAMG